MTCAPWDSEGMSTNAFQWIVVIELLLIVLLLAFPRVRR